MNDNETSPPLYQTLLRFPRPLTGAEAEALSDLLEESVHAVFLHNEDATDGDSWHVTLNTFGEPDRAAIAERVAAAYPDFTLFDMAVEKMPERDWLRHVHDNFPPVTAGRFFIYGSHYEGEVPAGLVPLRIDAATAFGSGEHETTRGCLLALEKLAAAGHRFDSVLDMGCGSGILAIAAVKLWPDIKAVAIDIDPESVRVTARHADMNGVGHILCAAGDGYDTPLCGQEAPYDLIVANILAGPLIAMAPQAAAAAADGGFLVVSGLLARQEDDVTKAQVAAGFSPHDRVEDGAWRALTFRKGRKS